EPGQAEDTTQETFLKAYRALRRGTRPSQPRAWLLAIARNVCRTQWQIAGRRGEVVLGPDLDELPAAEADGPSAAEIAAAVATLSPQQRNVLLLRELDGLSFERIASQLGLSETAVHALFFRARRSLREQLAHEAAPLSCDEVDAVLARPAAERSRSDQD